MRYGGMGGLSKGRSINFDDWFEATMNELFGAKMRADENFCSQIWSALANVTWRHDNGDEAGYSFRAAGDLIAAIRGEGNYMDWYMSGPYGTMADEIGTAMATKGWHYTLDTDPE